MLRRIAVVCFALGCALHGRAQEQEVYINGSDTLHYTYTPLPGEEEPQAEKRPPFLRRVVKYFEGSTTDRTFEKKIDFTFAGGPSPQQQTHRLHGNVRFGAPRHVGHRLPRRAV